MKRIRRFTAALLAAVIVAFLSSETGFCGIMNFDKATADAQYSNLEGTTIYYDSGVSAEELYAAACAWTMVPTGLLEDLIRCDCRIYLTSTAVSDPEEDTYVTGETHYPVYVCDARDMSIVGAEGSGYIVCITQDNDIAVTVLHEIGHAFDGITATQEDGYIRNSSAFTFSTSDTWRAISAQYARAMSRIDTNTALNMYNNIEAFAEAFRLYCSKPEELRSVAPEAYEYIESAIAQYAA